jgi:hypothetical protein
MGDHWSRDEILGKYVSGILVLLISVAVAILGLIFWLGYEIFL